jgi:hypothetical protein
LLKRVQFDRIIKIVEIVKDATIFEIDIIVKIVRVVKNTLIVAL